MSEESFEVGDLVWVKKENYPLWPAKISQPPKEENRKEEKKMCYVCFLGSETCDWVANKKIQHHAEHLIPPDYEKTSPFLKNAIDEIILLSKDKPFKEVTKASPQVVENLEEKESMVDKQLMEEEQSPIKKRHSYKGDATTLKSKQPSLKEPVKGKQPPVKEKQRISKEPEKEKQPPVEEKQPSSKEPENEKQPPVEEKKVSLKKRVKNNHPLVEEMKLPIKKQRISKKQPSIKENQTSINTNPVREKRKQLEQIASTGKVSKKAGYSVKSPRVVERKRSLSKESVIGETSMSGSVPCSSKIQKIDDDDDSLRSSHSGLSADLSNPKDLKSDEDSVSDVSSISSSDWHPELLCRLFKTKDDDDDDRSVSSSSSRQSPRCEIVRPRKDEPNFQKPDSPTASYEFTFSKDKIFIPDREPSPVDDQYEKRLKMKHLEPTKKKIGFLGLGKMGQKIVKNLLISGHTVFVWNRTQDKCKVFVEAGAKPCKTPAEVVKNSDIIFNCVSDAFAVKSILFCPDGILKGLEDSCTDENIFKGFVEMSTIGYESSLENASDINDKGGRYLEACMSGTKTSANLGRLFILASGDPYVFRECKSCFHAIAENAYFVSSTIGISSKLSTTLSMCIGTSYAALAEATALANRLNVNMDDVFTLLKIRGIATASLLERGRNMIKGEHFNVEHSLRNQQKDMDLGLKLSDKYDQPQYLAAAANEVYKQAKMLGYGDLDVSAVFEAVKH